jgi:hypothetical protein
MTGWRRLWITTRAASQVNEFKVQIVHRLWTKNSFELWTFRRGDEDRTGGIR